MPDQRDASQPILGIDETAYATGFFRWQKTCGRGELGPGDLAANRAGSDLDDGVVADAFALSELRVGHEIKLVVVLGKPDGCVHGRTIFSKGCKAQVFLTVDFRWDVRHPSIVKCNVKCGEEVLCRALGQPT